MSGARGPGSGDGSQGDRASTDRSQSDRASADRSQCGLLAATPRQVAARVRAVLRKAPGCRFVGLRAQPAWSGPDPLEVDGREVAVVACASPLAVREALVAHADGAGPVVLLTDRAEQELGLDVLVRLAKRQLHELDPWQVVRDLFGARAIDRRLVASRWVADALLEAAPDEGYPALATGVLDLETAWGHLLERRFGLPGGTPSLDAVLAWAQAPGRGAALAREPEEGVRALGERLALSAGPAAAAVLAAAAAGAADRVVGIGLACRVVTHAARDHDPGLREAFVRLERLTGRHALTRVEAAAWADAAEAFVRRELSHGRARARPWLAAGEAVLGELRALERAALSDLLPAGLDQRLAAWGVALGRALAAPRLVVDDALEEAADRVGAHALASGPGGGAEGRAVAMALRLARWVAAQEREPGSPAASFEAAVRRHEDEGGFVDWARARVWDQGQAAALRDAYGALLARVDALRARDDQAFGALLAGWVAVTPRDAGPVDPGAGPVPVERVLDDVLAPLARGAPALLVVLDGVGMAVFRELEEDLDRRGWVRLLPAGGAGGRCGPGVAAFPTVTEVSRTSLLCGRLSAGTQQAEQAGFPRHAALVAAGAARRPPVLFHKDGLAGRESGLADAVHAALADREQRVVAVVINAVDDHLMKGEQVPVPWTVDRIRPLDAVLTAARQAGRVVLVTADHGHVLERGTTCAPVADGGERWRPGAGPPPAEQEVRLAGPRVSERMGGAVVAPWTERLRYAPGKRHGYHGGASPAEVVVPLAVFTGAPLEVPGWVEAPLVQPGWWRRAEPEPTAPPQAPGRRPRGAPALPPRPAEAGPLFAGVPTPAPVVAPGAGQEPAPERPAAGATWLDALLASETFQVQHARAGRAAPTPERVRAVLQALDERGGRMTQDALARRLELPALRVPTVLAALRRLLNVEGYPVLAVEDELVTLQRDLACVQFGLDRPGPGRAG